MPPMQPASLSSFSPPLSNLPGPADFTAPASVSVNANATPLEMLDNPQEWSAFSRPVETQNACWESSVVFEGMHCAACALTIEDALRSVPGVISAHVSAASYRGRVVWSDQAVKPSG